MGMTWENIRELRKSAGLTQADLAEKLGMNRATISKYETGDICPPLSIIYKLCDIFKCDFHDILPSYSPIPKPEYSDKLDELDDMISQFLIKEYGETHKGELESFNALRKCFFSLTAEGQQKAVERVNELSEIPRYKKPSGGGSRAVDSEENN